MAYTKVGPFVNVPPGTVPPPTAKKLDAATANAFDQGIKDAHDLIAAGGGGGGGASPTWANALPGTTFTLLKVGGVWPGVQTNRTDLYFIWKGPDPSPPLVTSRTVGQAGILDGVDSRFVTST